MQYKLLICFLFCTMISGSWVKCQENKALMDLEVATTDGPVLSLETIQDHPLSVFFFLSPDCPLCENYSLNINRMQAAYEKKGVTFFGVFPGILYKKEEITSYLDRFDMSLIALLDTQYVLRDVFKATVTPEVFVVDSQASMLYSGKIDNWIPALGKKRTIVNEFYLKDALEASLKGQSVPVPHTLAIGCFIE